MSRFDSWHRKISTGRHFQNGRHNTAQIQHCLVKFFNIGNQFGTSLSTHISNFDDIGQCWIFAVLWWPFWKWWPVEIFQCPISTPFHMWVDYDVPIWFLTSKNFYRSPFSKWPPQYRTNSTLFDFNVLNWFLTSKNFYRLIGYKGCLRNLSKCFKTITSLQNSLPIVPRVMSGE
jgi:hypothetical protein